MTSRKPTEELEHEHRIIQQVGGGMAVIIEKLESGSEIDPVVLTDLSEFMQTFGDKCHHGKEEDYLFKRHRLQHLQRDGTIAFGRQVGHPASKEKYAGSMRSLEQLSLLGIELAVTVLTPGCDRQDKLTRGIDTVEVQFQSV